MTWEYIAGYMDGEGHIGICRSRRSGLQVSVCLTNTHKQSLVEIGNFLRSNEVATNLYRSKRTKPLKSCYYLHATNHESKLKLLRSLRPYLIIKLKAADKVIAYIIGRNWQIDHTEEAFKTALHLYKRGKSLRDIEGILGISSRAFRNYAKKVRFTLRSRSEAVSLAWKLKMRSVD